MIQVMIDSYSFKKKPTGSQAGGVQNRLTKTTIREVESLEAVKEVLERGQTLRPGVLANCSKDGKDFIAGQLLMIDVDTYDKDGIKTTIKRCKELGLDPFIIFKSFSYETRNTKETIGAGKNKISNPNYNKIKYNHRVGFKLPVAITEADKFLDYINCLIDLFDGDESCKDAGRLSFGTCHKADYFNDVDVNITVLDKLVAEYKAKNSENCATSGSVQTTLTGMNTGVEGCKNTFNNGQNVKNLEIYNIYNTLNTLRSDDEQSESNTPQSIDITGLQGFDTASMLHNFEQHIKNMRDRAYTSYESLIAVFNEYDLTRDFGSNSFCCVFHNENKPSAKIMTNKDTKGTHYYCYSNNCEIDAISPFNFFMMITGKSYNEAIKELLTTYQLRMISEDLKIQAELSFNSVNNILLEVSNEKTRAVIKVEYPAIVKQLRIGKTTQVISAIKDFKMYCLNRYPITNKAGEHIFFMSVRTLAEHAKSNYQTVDRVISMLTYSELIEKVDDKDVPKKFIEESKEMYKQEDRYTVQYYKMLQWTVERKERAEELLKEWNDKRIRSKAITTKALDNAGIGAKVKPKSSGTKHMTLYEKNAYKAMDEWVRMQLRKGIFIDKKFFEKAKKTFVEYNEIQKDNTGEPLLTATGDIYTIKKKKTISSTVAFSVQQAIIEKRGLKSVTINKAILEKYPIKGAKSNQIAFIKK